MWPMWLSRSAFFRCRFSCPGHLLPQVFFVVPMPGHYVAQYFLKYNYQKDDMLWPTTRPIIPPTLLARAERGAMFSVVIVATSTPSQDKCSK